MDQSICAVTKPDRAQGNRPAAPGAPSTAAAPSADRFETLLGEVTQALKTLKDDSRGESKGLSPDTIQRPEELEQALNEAGRKYNACVKAGKHLAQAYQDTMKGLQK